MQNPGFEIDPDVLKRVVTWNEMTRTGRRGTYTGTVPSAEKAKRRAKNKAARAARKKSR